METPHLLHAFPHETVFDFLSQWNSAFAHLNSDVMGYFSAGDDQLLINQPNGQAGAGGQP